MIRRRPTNVVFLLPFLALGIAACDDPAATAEDVLAEFEQAGVQTALDQRLAVFSHSVEANANFWHFLFSGIEFDVQTAAVEGAPGLALRSAAPGDRTRLSALRVAPPAIAQPEINGSTFVYDPDAGEWHPDDTQTGAPATGFRVTWYAMNQFFDIATPLVVRGYVDVIDRATGDDLLLDFQIVRTQGGTAVLADFTLSDQETETQDGYSDQFSMEGHVSDGSQQVNFDVSSTETGNFNTDTYTSTIQLAMTASGFAYALALGESETPGTYTGQLDASVTAAGATTAVDLGAEGDGDVASGSLTHKSVKVADVTVNLNTGAVTATQPGGAALSSAQQQQVSGLVNGILGSIAVLFGYLFGGF